jgi:ferrous iron transport protein A
MLEEVSRGFQMQLVSTEKTPEKFDFRGFPIDTELVLQTSVKKGPVNLSELKRGETATLERIDLEDEHEARRLMELGFLPGHTVTAAQSAPGGDPRVFRVDGSEVALRRETARRLLLQR